jgi:hypothetical protein
MAVLLAVVGGHDLDGEAGGAGGNTFEKEFSFCS